MSKYHRTPLSLSAVVILLSGLVILPGFLRQYAADNVTMAAEPSGDAKPRKRTELEKYMHHELMASRSHVEERAKEFAASVQPVGEKSLFEGFSIDTREVASRATKMSFTKVTQDPSGNVVDDREKVAPSDLDKGRCPLALHDLALKWTRDRLIERQLLEAFLTRWKLAPPLSEFSAKVIQDTNGPSLEIRCKNERMNRSMDAVSGKTVNEEEMAEMKQRAIRSYRVFMAMRNFEARLGEFATTEEIPKYFPGGKVQQETQIIEFLKAHAKIEKQEPRLVEEVRNHGQRHREFNARCELEALLLEKYFQKHGLIVPAEKLEVKKSWNPRELDVTISAKGMDISPFRQPVMQAPNPENASDVEKKNLDLVINTSIRLFQLQAGEWMFARKIKELVSAKDQNEFFDGGKVVTRARLIKYLRERAVQLGLDDILKSQSQSKPSDPVEAKNE